MKKTNFYHFNFVKKITILLVLVAVFSSSFSGNIKTFAMPFYALKPQEICLRASFSTTYSQSSKERKSNIKLAASSLNGTLVDVGGEFSFNLTVGERTEGKGYKNAKIIVGGEFVDGVGGGVCQVSTTLYNAVLLAGLKITEYHPHSLSVSYVPPSFDAMVNSSFADLKFLNDTDNPILIFTNADEEKITIEIYGQKSKYKYVRKSVVTELIPPLNDKIIVDDKKEFPELYNDEFKRIKCPKDGIKSQGYILIYENDKIISIKKLRSDYYKSIQGVIVQGTKERDFTPEIQLPNNLS